MSHRNLLIASSLRQEVVILSVFIIHLCSAAWLLMKKMAMPYLLVCLSIIHLWLWYNSPKGVGSLDIISISDERQSTTARHLSLLAHLCYCWTLDLSAFFIIDKIFWELTTSFDGDKVLLMFHQTQRCQLCKLFGLGDCPTSKAEQSPYNQKFNSSPGSTCLALSRNFVLESMITDFTRTYTQIVHISKRRLNYAMLI